MAPRITCSSPNVYNIILTLLTLLDPTAAAPLGIFNESSARLIQPRHNSGVLRSFAPRSLAGGLSSSTWSGIGVIVAILGLVIAIIGIWVTWRALPKQREKKKVEKERKKRSGVKEHRTWYGQIKRMFVKKAPRREWWRWPRE